MFSADAWARNAALYEKIRTMPFNRELADGSLPMRLFQHYMVQDAHYLVAFGQGLAIAAAKADDPDHIVQFSQGAATAILVERDLHTTYFGQFGLSPDQVAATPMSPIAHHYTAFLLATGFREPLAVQAAAMLPCFWIYREVGNDILKRATEPNPYRAWIDTYAGEEYGQAVDSMIATVDVLAAEASPKIQEDMHRVFTRAAQLEWMFWDSAYRDASWPV